ncbi:MAG: T9SS type A sorting domain-containing protein [Chloroherpetonaceae bacterium]
MMLAITTTATAQDATLNFNYVSTGSGAGTYTVLGDNFNQPFFSDCALQTVSLRAGSYTVSARLTRNNRIAQSNFGNFPATVSYIKVAVRDTFNISGDPSPWLLRATLAERPIDTGLTFTGSVDVPAGGQVLIYIQSFWDVPGSFLGFVSGTGTTGNFRVDGAPRAPNFTNLAATAPDQFGYRYPSLTWTNPNTDAGQLTNVRIYRRRVQGNTIIQNWSLRATLSPSGASQTQSWTDNTITTAQLGNDAEAQYRITIDDDSTPANTSPNSQTRGIFYSNNMFSTTGKRFYLSQNYPNPFNPTTTIDFSLPERAVVSLKVFDALGREVAVLLNESREPGAHQVAFNAGGTLSSGVYYYTLRYGAVTQTKKMILAK